MMHIAAAAPALANLLLFYVPYVPCVTSFVVSTTTRRQTMAAMALSGISADFDPPYICTWGVLQDDKDRADVMIEEFKLHFGVALDDRQTRALRFLYAKKVHEHVAFQLSDIMIMDSPPSVLFPATDWARNVRDRLYLLTDVTTGDTISSAAPDNVQSWHDFLQLAPEWNDSNTSFVFHRDHEQVNLPGQPDCLVQRLEKSGLCYVHGPVVLQHYLVAMGNEEPTKRVPMMDLKKYIRSHFPPEALYDHIFWDGGGSSRDMLQSILVPGSRLDSWNAPGAYEAKLKRYGAALASKYTRTSRPEGNSDMLPNHKGRTLGDIAWC